MRPRTPAAGRGTNGAARIAAMSGRLPETTVAALAARLAGTVAGDGAAVVRGCAGLDEAGPGEIAFVRDRAAFDRARRSRAGALIVPAAIPGEGRPQIVVADPVLAMGALLRAAAANGRAPATGVHPTAVLGADVTLGEGVAIGPHCVVGDGCRLGARTRLHPHVVLGAHVALGPDCELMPQVTLCDGVTLGARVRVDCGSSIGTEGFTVVVRPDGLYRLPQVGTVVLGDDVEVGAHVTIDRATFEATRIGNGVKMDNHVHVAHNVVVGDHTLLVAYAKIAGSTTLGRHVVVAEDVGITDNVTIGDRCRIGGGSRVFRSLPPGTEWWGHPARPLAQARRIAAALARLPELRDEVRALRRHVQGGREAGA